MYPSNEPRYQTAYPEAYPVGGQAAPASNVGWAVVALLFFWPLSFSAFTHAIGVYPKWASGDVAGAVNSSAQAKRLGKIALGIGVAMMVLVFILYVAIIAAAVSTTATYSR